MRSGADGSWRAPPLCRLLLRDGLVCERDGRGTEQQLGHRDDPAFATAQLGVVARARRFQSVPTDKADVAAQYGWGMFGVGVGGTASYFGIAGYLAGEVGTFGAVTASLGFGLAISSGLVLVVGAVGMVLATSEATLSALNQMADVATTTASPAGACSCCR